MPALLAPVIEWLSVTLWPFLLRMIAATGLTNVYILMRDWVTLFFAEKVFRGLIGSMVIAAGLAAWAVFLAVFWSFTSWDALRDIFNANPFSGITSLAGSLYLASYFFPFHFLFGISVAYIQWRLTMIHAAIILNRLFFILLSK